MLNKKKIFLRKKKKLFAIRKIRLIYKEKNKFGFFKIIFFFF
jgi:hypothetical protein